MRTLTALWDFFHCSFGVARLEGLRRVAGDVVGAAARFSRAFFFRCRSLRQRTIGREPRPM
jgi:hypothetical protein